MKFTCDQQTLSKALNTVSKAVTTKTTIPILKGILLQLQNDVLTLAASDLDLSIERKIKVDANEEGNIVVSAKLFSDIIRKLPNEPIEIERQEDDSILIRCKTSEFKIVGLAAEEYPNIGDVNQSDKIKFDIELLKDMIKKTSFSASMDESKGVIVGVLIEMEENSLHMVALDGFRMAITREGVENSENSKIIIPARILNEIYKIISEADENEELYLMLDDKKAVFLLEDTKIILRLLEGEFIRYRDIVPKEHQCSFLINRMELAESIERASLLAKEGKNNLIKMDIFNDKVTITSRSEEGNVKEEIDIQKDGIDLEIGFNSKYVLDVLKAVDDDQVKMEFNTGVTPCMIRPVTGDAFEYLVLPVRISSN